MMKNHVTLAVSLVMVAGTAFATDWEVPRTPDGRPDLQGVWANNSATPLERPQILAGRDRLTESEVAALRARADAPGWQARPSASFISLWRRSLAASVLHGGAAMRVTFPMGVG